MRYDISHGHGHGAYTDIYFKGTQFGGEGGDTKFGTPKIDAHGVSEVF